jgi:hypothetical protein
MFKPRYEWRLFSLVAASTVAAVMWFSVHDSESLPEEWPGKDIFCAKARLLGVGEPRLSPEGHAEVLRQLQANAPAPLEDQLADINEATVGTTEVSEDTVEEVGRFIETRCGVNLPGVTPED